MAVQTFDPKDFEIQWRVPEAAPGYEVSNLGVIRRLKDGKWLRFGIGRTTVGSYLVACFNVEGRNRGSHGVHVLVCHAWHGPPPSGDVRYEPNHLDGNKHNNLPGNLEWTTRSENIIHSYETGIRNDSLRVVETNHETGEEVTYYSMAELARRFGLVHLKGWSFARRYQKEKYEGKYTYRLVEGNYKAPKRKHGKIVMAFDYKTNKLHITYGLTEMELTTGICSNLIKSRMKAKTLPPLINGVVFTWGENSDDLYRPTKAEIEDSIEEFKNYKVEVRRRPVVVKNYVDGTETTYPRLGEMLKALGDVGMSLRTQLQRYCIDMTKGMAVKYADNDKPFKDYTDEQIAWSAAGHRIDSKYITVTDKLSNTTKRYPSISAFAKEIGGDEGRVRNAVRRGDDYLHFQIVVDS